MYFQSVLVLFIISVVMHDVTFIFAMSTAGFTGSSKGCWQAFSG